MFILWRKIPYTVTVSDIFQFMKYSTIYLRFADILRVFLAFVLKQPDILLYFAFYGSLVGSKLSQVREVSGYIESEVERIAEDRSGRSEQWVTESRRGSLNENCATKYNQHWNLIHVKKLFLIEMKLYFAEILVHYFRMKFTSSHVSYFF